MLSLPPAPCPLESITANGSGLSYIPWMLQARVTSLESKVTSLASKEVKLVADYEQLSAKVNTARIRDDLADYLS